MKNFVKYTLIIILMLVFINAEAQATADEINDMIGFDDDVNDTTAPINFLIPLAIAIGAALGIRKLK
jgi:hypothetical protein